MLRREAEKRAILDPVAVKLAVNAAKRSERVKKRLELLADLSGSRTRIVDVGGYVLREPLA